MGLDIYVGTLTRYMTRDWETVIEQWARETGQPLTMLRTNPEPDDAVTDPDVVLEVVDAWRHAVGEAIGRTLEWNERLDAPYFTDKPDWDSFGSVQVLAARVELGERAMPEERVTDWSKDEAWRRASQGHGAKYVHLYLPELWVPLDVPVFQTAAPWEQEIVIGSSGKLLAALREVNDQTYRVGPEDRAVLEPSEGPFDDAARFGLAILLTLAQQSVDHRLPLKLDY